MGMCRQGSVYRILYLVEQALSRSRLVGLVCIVLGLLLGDSLVQLPVATQNQENSNLDAEDGGGS